MQIKDPIRVSIEAKKGDDGKWHLKYREFFGDDDVGVEAKTTINLIKRAYSMLSETEVDATYHPEENCVEINVVGNKDVVFSALASEFLTQSHFGQMTLREALIGTTIVALMSSKKGGQNGE